MLLTVLLGSLACTDPKSNDIAVASDTSPPEDSASTHTGQPDTAVPVDTADSDDPETSSEHFVLDFSLPDANPSSTSFGQPVSPRDYLDQVSGWYFIKAT